MTRESGHDETRLSTDPAAAEREGDAKLRAGDLDGAREAYRAAAESVERASGALCTKLARTALTAGDSAGAILWAQRVVGADARFQDWVAAARVLEKAEAPLPSLRRTLRVAVVGTWTTRTFASLLRLAAAHLGIAVELRESDFGQYFNETLEKGSDLHAFAPDAVVLCPEARALGLPAYSEDPGARRDGELARWTGVWHALREPNPAILVQHGFASDGSDAFGHYASGRDGTRRALTRQIDTGLARAAEAHDVGYVDVGLLAARFGKQAWFDDRNWYLAKIPYSNVALPILARHTAAVLAARLGLSRRCLVLDLDNTLWGGVVADDGLDGIRLGAGVEGEAFVEFQAGLKELAERGVVLAACSKNDEAIAREPFRRHPDMLLREDDIALFAANWSPKSENIASIAEALSLGLDAITFFDDNPYERSEVRRALPAVDVPVLPEDVTRYRRFLDAYPDFEPAGFAAADADRTAQYRARARAIELRENSASLDEYQATLDMRAQIGPIDDANVARVVQLINKTNQFNVTTVRRNRAELDAWMREPHSRHFWVRMRDRFADHGLIAVVLVQAAQDGDLEIDSILMSCRVVGRGLESVLFEEIGALAKRMRCKRVVGRYVPTARNGMVAQLFAEAGFTLDRTDAEGATCWSAAPDEIDGRKHAIAVERVAAQEARSMG